MTSPLRPSISAGASGVCFPAARTNSGTDRLGISTSGYGLVRATGSFLLGADVAPVSHPVCGPAAGAHRELSSGGGQGGLLSPGPENPLRAAEQRDRLAGLAVGHDRVPHLGGAAGVHVDGDGLD